MVAASFVSALFVHFLFLSLSLSHSFSLSLTLVIPQRVPEQGAARIFPFVRFFLVRSLAESNAFQCQFQMDKY